MKIYTVCTHN